MNVTSADGVRIAFEQTGADKTALIFMHGWLGSGRWFDAQRDAFSSHFTVVQVDLAGHGASGRDRVKHSVEAYAADIEAVAKKFERVVLIGHSMSGAHALHATLHLPNVLALVLVDTLKNVEQQIPAAQIDQILGMYRADFAAAIKTVAPQWLFAKGTPPEVAARLTTEFLTRSGDEGASLLEPLYRHDIKADADRCSVPVRAINSDAQPTDVAANRRHFRDFDARIIEGVGHYPMLEAPAAFNASLRETLTELKLVAAVP
ncbi:MAG: alpha/beta hydrolase [Archangium sp.]